MNDSHAIIFHRLVSEVKVKGADVDINNAWLTIRQTNKILARVQVNMT
jgi:hypothetical protein